MAHAVLSVRKRPRTRRPWCLGLLDADGRFQALEGFTFVRQRDGALVLAALEDLAQAWGHAPATWPPAVWEALRARLACSSVPWGA